MPTSISSRRRKVETGHRSSRKWRAGAAVSVLLAAALAIAFQASAFQRFLVETWMEELERRSGLRLEMAEWGWRLPFELVLGKAEVIRDGQTVIRCERATMRLAPCLDRPFWRVASLTLDQPVFHLEKDFSGRWRTAGEPPEASDRGQLMRAPARSQMPWRPISVRIQSGTILGQQDGREVLKVGNITGQLTLPDDGVFGMSSLLANLEKFRPAAPLGLNLKKPGHTPP